MCEIEGCGAPRHGNGLCGKHYMRMRRYGTVEVRIRPRGSYELPYNNMHQKVRRVRGKASEHDCSCGQPARHWAYNHSGVDEAQGFGDGYGAGQLMTYSYDVDQYDPMCVPCHKKFDLEVA